MTHIRAPHHTDASTSLTPGFQRLNTAATPAASPGGRGRGGKGGAKTSAVMMRETPLPSSSGRVRPAALERKLRRLAAEALDKVGGWVRMALYSVVRPGHLELHTVLISTSLVSSRTRTAAAPRPRSLLCRQAGDAGAEPAGPPSPTEPAAASRGFVAAGQGVSPRKGLPPGGAHAGAARAAGG